MVKKDKSIKHLEESVPRDKIYGLSIALYLFNVIIFLSSIGLLAVASYILSTTAYLTEFLRVDTIRYMPSLLQQACFGLAFAGLILFVISIIGVSAVYQENIALMRAYTLLLFVAIVLQVTMAVLVSIFRAKATSKLHVVLTKRLKDEYKGYLDVSNRFTLSLNWAQITYECCGINNWTDFQKAVNWDRSLEKDLLSKEIPVTCCKFVDKSFYPTQPQKLKYKDRRCPVFPTKENSWVFTPCFNTVYKDLLHYMQLVFILALCLMATQVIGLVLSFLLGIFLKQRQEFYEDLLSSKFKSSLL